MAAVVLTQRESTARRFGKGTLKFIKRRPLGAFGGISLIALVFVAIFADVIAPFSPVRQFSWEYATAAPLTQGPEGTFWFGTDKYARDLFSRVVYGSRISLYVGILSVLIGSTIGTVIGVYSGYAGGKIDMIIQRIVDVKIGFPALIVTILLVAVLGQSLNNVVLAIAFSIWARFSRVARAAALSTREMDYVLAARALGASSRR
ncbi:MAG: ABC transporter permease, partial [SAR202 cluster bacterium]|nr:ABC transporter permease [SAR202 cluster bacterium]